MTEKDFYPLFRDKLKELKFANACVFELKLVKNSKRFVLSSVHQHQIDGLLGASHGLSYRIVDQPFVQGGFSQKKPFDMVWFKDVDGFIVPIFYQPRKKKTAYLIPIKDFSGFPGTSVKEADLGKFVSIEL